MTGLRVMHLARRHAKTVGISQREACRLLSLIEEDVLMELTAGRAVSFAGIRFYFKFEPKRLRYNLLARGITMSRPRIACVAKVFDKTQKKLLKLLDET
jgi:hypothetical protein